MRQEEKAIIELAQARGWSLGHFQSTVKHAKHEHRMLALNTVPCSRLPEDVVAVLKCVSNLTPAHARDVFESIEDHLVACMDGGE